MDEKVQPSHGILVIDDEFGPRESLRFLLKDRHAVVCADSVEKGIEHLRVARPDVVILDIRMPGKTGIQGLREIRAVDPHVSIIMLTGYGSLETAQEAIRLGANDYIKKPFDAKEMRETVGRYVERTRLARRRAETAQQLEVLNEELRQELARTQELASLGQASSEFVHDLRNLLTVICGYVGLLSEDVARAGASGGKVDDAMAYLEIIARNAERCREMSLMWKDLGRRNPERFRLCSIPELLREIVRTTLPLAEESRVRLTMAHGPEGCVLPADEIQLFRALQNVITNAVQAAPREAGQVSVEWRQEGDAVLIRVLDNGPGVDPDLLPKVFTPRVTTKGDRGGMGLGLYVAKRVIEDTHGGAIRLANREDGPGAVAEIRLPLAPLPEGPPRDSP